MTTLPISVRDVSERTSCGHRPDSVRCPLYPVPVPVNLTQVTLLSVSLFVFEIFKQACKKLELRRARNTCLPAERQAP